MFTADYPSSVSRLVRSHSASELISLRAQRQKTRPGGGDGTDDDENGTHPKFFRRISVPSPPKLHCRRSRAQAPRSLNLQPSWTPASMLDRIARRQQHHNQPASDSVEGVSPALLVCYLRFYIPSVISHSLRTQT